MGIPPDRLDLLCQVNEIVKDLPPRDALLYILACMTNEELKKVIEMSKRVTGTG